MLQPSLHSVQRGAQRNLSMEELEYVIRHGKIFHRAGALFFFLRNCDIATEDRSNGKLARLVGTAVVVSKDERTVITTWRNRRAGLKKIKRKPRYDLSHDSPFSARIYQ